MRKRRSIFFLPTTIVLIIAGLVISITGCSEDVSKDAFFKPISAGEKYLAKQFRHSELIQTLVSSGMHEADINRHLYLLQAVIRQVEVYDKCAMVGADLSARAIQIESKEIGSNIVGKAFLEGQALFIQNKTDEAKRLLNQFLKQTGENTKALRNTTKLYLDAIENGIPFGRLFLTSEGKVNQLLPGCLNDQNQTLTDLLSTDFNVFPTVQYKCGGDDICEWEIPDLSVYPYIKAMLLAASLPYTSIKFQEVKAPEKLFYKLLANLVEAYRTGDYQSLDDILKVLNEKGVAHKRPFASYYQIAHSLRSTSVAILQDKTMSEPLTLLRVLGRNGKGEWATAEILEVYETVLPNLFNASLSTEYRDYLYVELWNFLWLNDVDLLEQFRLSKGYSPGVVAPDFFLDLLPYRVSHPRENPLGNKDLKTQVQYHPYLRPLIRSYEYIAEKSKPNNAGKTGVG